MRDLLSAATLSKPITCNLILVPQPQARAGTFGLPGQDFTLCAVDEATDLIVMEVGIERYEYQDQKATTVVHLSSDSRSIPPGVTTQITVRPQQGAIRPRRLIIGGNTDRWVVHDIRIGGRTQLSQAGALPGDLFSSTSIDAFLSMSVVQVTMDFTIIVSYVGRDPGGEPFFGALLCEEVEYGRGKTVTRVGRRFIARWTPEGRREPWMTAADPTAGELDPGNKDAGAVVSAR
jgi:hypothetical protein